MFTHLLNNALNELSTISILIWYKPASPKNKSLYTKLQMTQSDVTAESFCLFKTKQRRLFVQNLVQFVSRNLKVTSKFHSDLEYGGCSVFFWPLGAVAHVIICIAYQQFETCRRFYFIFKTPAMKNTIFVLWLY